VKAPAVPVVANVVAAPISDPQEIVKRLVEQVTGTVRWRECVECMAAAGVTQFYEVGAGKVLTGSSSASPKARLEAPSERRTTSRRSRRRAARRHRARLIKESRMFDLTGKTALVTGASGGIGAPSRARCTAQGARVAISGTRREARCARGGTRRAAVVLPCDLADKPKRSRRWCRRPRRRMGQLDILVANAGITRTTCLCSMRDEDWEQVIAVNLTATFRLARAAVKGMMRRRFGRIGITSVVGVTGNPGQGNYTAAKAGMIGMFKSLGKEYAKRGVTANCVAPGFIATPMTDKLNDKQREAILRVVPAGRLGEGGCRGGGGLSCVRRGGLCDRADPARQRRNGDDLTDMQGCGTRAHRLVKAFEVC
jgi:NAD(P)-dependent dehydrogenase (short-subunit alcohol dehydrogenase family)